MKKQRSLRPLFSASRLPLLTLLVLAGFIVGLGVWAAVEQGRMRAAWRAVVPAPVLPRATAPMAAPMITVNKTAALATDVNGNGFVNPGDTLMYSVTITNSRASATSVVFSDVLNDNLTLAVTHRQTWFFESVGHC